MSKKWRLTDRTRTLLTLELAIVLPAAALLGFSVWNLKHIQRSEAIEAAIQRDFSHVLYIVEKKALHKAVDVLTPVRKDFPSPDDDRSVINAKLEHILSEHPEFAYALIYDKKRNLLVSRGQPSRDHDLVFCAGVQDTINTITNWLPLEASTMAAHARAMEEKDEDPFGFDGGWCFGQNQNPILTHLFYPPGVPKDRVTLGLVSFDNDYLRQNFLPAVMKDVLTSKNGVLMAGATCRARGLLEHRGQAQHHKGVAQTLAGVGGADRAGAGAGAGLGRASLPRGQESVPA